MEFTMLCATRIADITGGKEHSVPMLWSHVDLTGALWRIPDTKMSRPFDVPLSDPALRLLGEMKQFTDLSNPEIVFPGAVGGTVLSSATLRHMLKAMGYGGTMTTHGARSLFKTWAAETTNFEKGVVESCLAHQQTELDQAYHRGSYLDKRRRLMAAWAAYLEGHAVQVGGSVVALHG
jgi:integrase